MYGIDCSIDRVSCLYRKGCITKQQVDALIMGLKHKDHRIRSTTIGLVLLKYNHYCS